MKVSLKVEIKSEDNYTKLNTNGILNEKLNILTYGEEKNTKVKLYLDKDELVRENAEFIMKLSFIKGKTTNINIYMKDIKQEINMQLKTLEIIKNSMFYKVIYIVEGSTENQYIVELKK